jgi:hypothetical protein
VSFCLYAFPVHERIYLMNVFISNVEKRLNSAASAVLPVTAAKMNRLSCDDTNFVS